MNGTELVRKIASDADVTNTQAKAIVDGVFDAIMNAAASGDEVSIAGFGKFKVKDIAARVARNPSTGAEVRVAASKKVTFTPSKALKDKVAG